MDTHTHTHTTHTHTHQPGLMFMKPGLQETKIAMSRDSGRKNNVLLTKKVIADRHSATCKDEH